MDLTRLYNLTTPELREEAERLGVGDTYAMSRGQLIHAIRSAAAGGQQSEGLLGKVLGFAKWALQAAQEEPRKEAASQPPRNEAPAAPKEEARRFGRPAETPLPSLGSASVPSRAVPASVPESESVPAPVPVPESESVPASVPAPAFAPLGEDGGELLAEGPAESEPPLAAARLSAADSGPPDRPPVGVFSKTASMFEEPFPTLTMARILAEQGHFKRALAIYATLIREEPEDGALSAEAEEVRAQSRARRSQIQ